jgi:hypothetical protein
MEEEDPDSDERRSTIKRSGINMSRSEVPKHSYQDKLAEFLSFI